MPDQAPATPRDSFFAATYEVSKGAVTRSREGAQFVEKAAAGIVAVYSAVLAVVFSVAENPLPLRGIIPAVFLALALALAAFALAYPVSAEKMPPPKETDDHLAWFNAFAAWVSKLSLRRSKLLRASLLALMFGVLFLPAPFVDVKADPPNEAATNAENEENWPEPPISDNIELLKILYTAQVAEVAKQREDASPPPSGEYAIREKWIWIAAAIAGLTVLLSGFRRAPGVPKGGGTTPFLIVPTYVLARLGRDRR